MVRGQQAGDVSDSTRLHWIMLSSMLKPLIRTGAALSRNAVSSQISHSILNGQDDIEVVGEASDGGEAIELALTSSPDVVLMDIRMPKLDGIEATRRLLSAGRSRARVLILTTFDQDEYVYEAFRAGASGFLLKSAPPRELAGAIRTVAAGDALLAPEITRRMIETMSGARIPARVHRPRWLRSRRGNSRS